jgi:hypothetical protein
MEMVVEEETCVVVDTTVVVTPVPPQEFNREITNNTNERADLTISPVGRLDSFMISSD